MNATSKRALGPLLMTLGLLAAPGTADAQVLQALANVGRAGIPVASGILDSLGVTAANPALAGAMQIFGGDIVGGASNIVSAYTGQQVNVSPAAAANFNGAIQGLGTSIQNAVQGAPPLLPGRRASAEVDELREEVAELEDLIEELREDLEDEAKKEDAPEEESRQDGDAPDPEAADSDSAAEALGDAGDGEEAPLPKSDQLVE